MSGIDNDIIIYQGSTFKLDTTLTAISGAVSYDSNGNVIDPSSYPVVPIDITNDTFSGSIIDNYDFSNVLANFTITATVPTSGQLTISLTPTQTSALASCSCINPGQRIGYLGVYGVKWHLANGDVYPILEGKVKLSRDANPNG